MLTGFDDANIVSIRRSIYIFSFAIGSTLLFDIQLHEVTSILGVFSVRNLSLPWIQGILLGFLVFLLVRLWFARFSSMKRTEFLWQNDFLQKNNIDENMKKALSSLYVAKEITAPEPLDYNQNITSPFLNLKSELSSIANFDGQEPLHPLIRVANEKLDIITQKLSDLEEQELRDTEVNLYRSKTIETENATLQRTIKDFSTVLSDYAGSERKLQATATAMVDHVFETKIDAMQAFGGKLERQASEVDARLVQFVNEHSDFADKLGSLKSALEEGPLSELAELDDDTVSKARESRMREFQWFEVRIPMAVGTIAAFSVGVALVFDRPKIARTETPEIVQDIIQGIAATTKSLLFLIL